MSRLFAFAASGLAIKTSALQISSGCDGLSMSTFTDFVEKYEREYTTQEEYAMRKALFDSRVLHISGHNCADAHPWKAQVNHMADWTEAELQSLRGYKRTNTASSRASGAPGPLTNLRSEAMAQDEVPESISWSHLESIKRPRDQGQCGSCWAYAATTVLDAHAEINNRSNSFSVAQIIACTPNPQQCGGSGGCDGATAELAYEYALQAGIVDSSEFPALPGGAQPKCPDSKKPWGEFIQTGEATPAVHMQDGTQKHLIDKTNSDGNRMGGLKNGMLGWTKFPENKEMQLVQGLVSYGPVAVAVAAGGDWNWYFHGILTPQGCDRKNVISHAVVLYGYGKAMNVKLGEVKYWQIKNSWGRGWGEDGSMRLQRVSNEEEYCGWDNSPEVGSGCKGGPSKVWVCGSCGILYDTVMPQFRL